MAAIPFLQRLEVRLVIVVGAALLAFSAVAGFFTYGHAFRHELDLADSLERQLVDTVRAQAEVAAYARNEEIAQGVLQGLLANPVVLAAGIESDDGFKAERGSRQEANIAAGTRYVLYSPVDQLEPIGTLRVVRNARQVEEAAAGAAQFQTLLLLLQLLVTGAILAAALRLGMVRPIIGLARAMEAIRPGSPTRLPLDPRHARDELGLLVVRANAILDATQSALAEVEAQRSELERMATHDHLTGLPTIRLADDRLQVACSSARRHGRKVALLFIDMDGFKAINDGYGHDTGDEVLRELARRLRECIRAEDTAARLGGDEFVVILGNLSDAQAAGQVARTIGDVLSRPLQVAGDTVVLGASIGIAIFPDHTGDVQALRHVADQAMYRVKRTGKGSYAFVDPGGLA